MAVIFFSGRLLGFTLFNPFGVDPESPSPSGLLLCSPEHPVRTCCLSRETYLRLLLLSAGGEVAYGKATDRMQPVFCAGGGFRTLRAPRL